MVSDIIWQISIKCCVGRGLLWLAPRLVIAASHQTRRVQRYAWARSSAGRVVRGPSLEIHLVRVDGPGQAWPKRLGLCGQQLLTNLHSTVQIHVEHNGTLWQYY